MHREWVVAMRTGIGQVEFKPKIGLPIMGHPRDDYASRGFHDPLYCKAVVFADSAGATFAMLSLDICMLHRSHVAMLRDFVEQDTSIPAESILIAATHTHGGPATGSIYTCPTSDEEDIAEFLKNAARAVTAALANMADTEIKIGYAEEERLSFNRRLKCKDGRTHMSWEPLENDFIVEPLGPIDPRLTVVSIEQAGKSAGAIVNFALHPAIVDYENFDYTADYPGYMSESMRKIVGDDFVTVFVNGCCGDINHIEYLDKTSPRRGFVMSQRCGYILAVDAYEALRNARAISTDAIAVSREYVELDRIEVGEQLYREAKAFLANRRAETHIADGLSIEYAAPVWVEMYENPDKTGFAEVMVARIGELAVVGLPGEIFCRFGLQIREQSPAKHNIVVELANDAIGYIPTSEAYDQGGYEPTPGAANYGKGSGERLVASALEQLDKLF